eukprot:jgi/Bigna1/74668/fgenesh1_pg.30_\
MQISLRSLVSLLAIIAMNSAIMLLLPSTTVIPLSARQLAQGPLQQIEQFSRSNRVVRTRQNIGKSWGRVPREGFGRRATKTTAPTPKQSYHHSGFKSVVQFRNRSRIMRSFRIKDYEMLRSCEFKSVAHASGIEPSDVCFEEVVGCDGLLQYVDGINKDDLIKVADRCILVHGAHEIWAEGRSHEEAARQLEVPAASRVLPWRAHPVLLGKRKANISAVLDHYTDAVDMLGPVKFRNPALNIAVIEFWRNHDDHDNITLEKAFFGEVLVSEDIRDQQLRGDAVRLGGKGKRLEAFSLRKRHYCGFTAMDPELSFLMCNLAGVLPGSRVLDPFCGSCSILLAAAHLGAKTTVGVDVDAKVLTGQRSSRHVKDRAANKKAGLQADEDDDNIVTGQNNRISKRRHRDRANESSHSTAPLTIAQNFVAADLDPPSLVPGNSFDQSLPAFQQKYDAIVTDPPYGIMEISFQNSGEGARDLLPTGGLFDHAPFLRVIDLAGSSLVDGGRVTFFWPVKEMDLSPTSEYDDDCPIRHYEQVLKSAGLVVINTAKQIMSSKWSRWLVTLEKTGPV